jgi:hypothetical protein
MGKQVNFFMHGGDEEAFLAVARGRGEVYILRYTSPTETFDLCEDLPPRDELGWFQVWLWDRSACKPPVAWWVEQQRYYTVDAFASEVIEFRRSYERDGRLIAGRIWTEFRGSRMGGPDVAFEKSPAFQKWYNSLASWIKRHYTRTPEGWYMGPGAKELHERGSRLGHADFASVVKLVRH